MNENTRELLIPGKRSARKQSSPLVGSAVKHRAIINNESDLSRITASGDR